MPHDLTELVTPHPTRERLRGGLMITLYRAPDFTGREPEIAALRAALVHPEPRE